MINILLAFLCLAIVAISTLSQIIAKIIVDKIEERGRESKLK